MRPRIATVRSVLMGVTFLALAGLAFVLLIARGWALPLGLVLSARLAFVFVEGHLTEGRWRTIPIMYRLGLGMHLLLATGFTLVGLAQVTGLL